MGEIAEVTCRPTLTSRSTGVKIALVLTLAVVLLGAVRFGRYDWTGAGSRFPMTAERVIDEECTALVRPYTTDSGRVIGPVSMDEQQYLSMVAYFRGTPKADLQATCLISPFATRPAVPWLAALTPLDEGAALSTINLAMIIAATWAVVFTLRAQGFAGRVTAAAGALFAVGWNTLAFSSSLLVDPAVVFFVAICWWLLALRRPWWVWCVLLVAHPFKETIALVVLPVLLAWTWSEWRQGRLTRGSAIGSVGAAVAAAATSFVVSTTLLLQPDADWGSLLSVQNVLSNLQDPAGLVVLVIATAPIGIPALLAVRDDLRTDGWRSTVVQPAVVGLGVTVALCIWVAFGADLSARFPWVGFPFAATLAAVWWSRDRARHWLDRLPAPAWIDA